MTHYVTGWKCTNIKAHDRALSRGGSRGNNPRGRNQHDTIARKKPVKRRREQKEKTECPSCGNGKRFDKKKCRLCGKKGWIWTIR